MTSRRAFISLIGGAAAAWPVAARAQQLDRIRRIGVLTPLVEDDSESRLRISAFRRGLAQLGWIEGRNLRVDYRWGAGDANRIRQYAAELVALAPDLVLAHGSLAVAPLQQASSTLPIIFVSVVDPIGAGFAESLARPGGNATGFTLYEYGLSGKWLELLREIAPNVTRVAILRDSSIAAGAGQLGALQTAAAAFRLELRPVGVRDPAEIERALTAFSSGTSDGLIVTGSTLALNHRNLIVALAARHKLPAVYAHRYFVTTGGLVSYGPDSVDAYQRSAQYVDRVLKGEKPSDLPVQAPTKYHLVINLKTAKSLGLEVRPTLLARADEVIE